MAELIISILSCSAAIITFCSIFFNQNTSKRIKVLTIIFSLIFSFCIIGSRYNLIFPTYVKKDKSTDTYANDSNTESVNTDGKWELKAGSYMSKSLLGAYSSDGKRKYVFSSKAYIRARNGEAPVYYYTLYEKKS